MELFVACVKNDIDKINSLIRDNVDVSKRGVIYRSDNNGNTIGHLCAIYKIYNRLIDLVDMYPKLVSYLNNEGKSLIHLIENYNPLNRVIDILIKNNMEQELNIIPYDNNTLLIELLNRYNDASQKIEYLHMIKKVLKNGAKINIPADNCPLNKYIIGNPDINIVSLLLKHGADPNLNNKDGLKSLNIAILTNKNPKIIKILLDYGADINYSGPYDKYIPIFISLKKGYNKIAKILIQYDPDLSQQDNKLNTPLHHAILSNKKLPMQVIKYLIRHCDLNIPNINGITPLHLLIQSNEWKKYYNIMDHDRTSFRDMNGYRLIKLINSLSNSILRNKIRSKCPNNVLINRTIDKKCVEGLKSIIKNNLFENVNNDIDIPEVVDTNYGLFGSNVLYNVIYLIQILKKYNNVFVPFQYLLPDKYINEIKNLQNLNLYKTKAGKMLHNVVSLYTEYFFEISPCVILWHSKNIKHHDSNIKIYIKKLLDSNNIRFIVIRLSLIMLTNTSHANIILYDKTTNTIERFEPYGSLNYHVRDIDELDQYLLELFRESISKSIVYRSPQEYMKNCKLQLISNESDLENKKIGDPDGFCLAWCFWFLELKLKNPDRNTESLIEKTLLKIIDSGTDSDKNIVENKILVYIRKYGKKLDMLKNDFLIGCGVNKNELYNMGYNNDKFMLLVNNISKEFSNIESKRVL